MPVTTQNDQLFALFKSLATQLQFIKDLDKEAYQAIIAESKIDSETEPTRFQLAKLATQDELYRKLIQTNYAKLNKFAIERKHLHAIQTQVKEEKYSIKQLTDEFTKFDFINLLEQKLKARSSTILDTLQKNASELHAFLTPSIQIKREEKEIKEESFSLQQFDQSPPDAFFIMGNNDLIQIEFMASLYHRAPKDKKPRLFVSGFGGHGTMHHPIFAATEGETITRKLLELGVPKENILTEYDAVDTGRNVKYIDLFMIAEHALNSASRLTHQEAGFLKKMLARSANQPRTAKNDQLMQCILEPVKKEIIEKNIPLYNHVLISGTPGGLLRQTRTYEKQTTLPWEKISCLTPNNLVENYYSTQHSALINIIYALREVASFLDYTVNTSFLPDREIIDKTELTKAITVFCNYFTLMSNEKVDTKKFIEQFIAFSADRNPNLITELNAIIKPTAQYFRTAFSSTEKSRLKKISSVLTLQEHSEQLDPRVFRRRASMINQLFLPPQQQRATGEKIESAILKNSR